MSVINPFDFFPEPYATSFPFKYEAWQRGTRTLPDPLPLTPAADGVPGNDSPREPRASVDFLVDLNQRVQHKVGYVIRLEPGVQTPEETLTLARGSCRDSAWLLVQVLRHLGLAARFVSGYLIQLVPDVKSLDGPSGTDHDFTDLHAWCEVYLPGAGWIGPRPDLGPVRRRGAHPAGLLAAAVVGRADHRLDREMRMRVRAPHAGRARLGSAARDQALQRRAVAAAIEALGHQIDADLVRDDVRLTMGGEPTFVSIDDHDGAEWNTDALGPTKRARAAEIFHRLREKYAPQGCSISARASGIPASSCRAGR
jgi:hypothetical protein